MLYTSVNIISQKGISVAEWSQVTILNNLFPCFTLLPLGHHDLKATSIEVTQSNKLLTLPCLKYQGKTSSHEENCWGQHYYITPCAPLLDHSTSTSCQCRALPLDDLDYIYKEKMAIDQTCKQINWRHHFPLPRTVNDTQGDLMP